MGSPKGIRRGTMASLKAAFGTMSSIELDMGRRSLLAPSWENMKAEHAGGDEEAFLSWIRHNGQVRRACDYFGV